ncbi:MAG: HAMP domain-containing histidine kinase [Nitrospinae bacterium]|nr:HAMP domain-containing histidine kinase [Nitrospinota bacterium]
MSKVVENLLTIGRLHTGTIKPETRPFNLKTLVAEKGLRLGQIADQKGSRLSIEIPGELEWLADESLVGAVLQNLLDNAVKFTPAGGAISVFMENERSICVRNTGAGISEKILPDIFKHHVKTSLPGTGGETGTGLGLPLSHDIMKAHGGELGVKNEPGIGVAFFIRLPVTR